MTCHLYCHFLVALGAPVVHKGKQEGGKGEHGGNAEQSIGQDVVAQQVEDSRMLGVDKEGCYTNADESRGKNEERPVPSVPSGENLLLPLACHDGEYDGCCRPCRYYPVSHCGSVETRWREIVAEPGECGGEQYGDEHECGGRGHRTHRCAQGSRGCSSSCVLEVNGEPGALLIELCESLAVVLHLVVGIGKLPFERAFLSSQFVDFVVE